MKTPSIRLLNGLCGLIFLTTSAEFAGAASLIFNDRDNFINATSAISATGGTISGSATQVTSYTQGLTTFSNATLTVGCPATGPLNYCQPDGWAPSLTGDDIAITGNEDFDASFSTTNPIFSVGFEMFEPTSANTGGGFVDSTFTISLFDGISLVDSFTFEPANDEVDFFGVWSSASFTKVEIRESVGGIENEFFGEFWISTSTEMPNVPLPAAAWLFGSALLGLFGSRHLRQGNR